MNPEDIGNASEIYFEQYSRVIATSAFIEQFVIKQQEAQELLAIQANERFDRKKELLEKQKILELELENEHLIEAQNKLQLIRLAENFEKGSICSDNNRDLEGMSKTQVDKTNSSFPFTNKKIGNEISEKYLIPSKSITSSKSNLSINITDNNNSASNAHSEDSNIPPTLPPKPK